MSRFGTIDAETTRKILESARPTSPIPAADERQTEKGFQADVIRCAKRLGWMCYHTHDSRKSTPGFPDLVLVHPIQRRLLVRELKTCTGTPTYEQEAWLAAFIVAGVDAGVWRPGDWREIEQELRG